MGASAPGECGEESQTICRICFEEARLADLISPCKCKGSLQYVHKRCLERWQRSVLKLGKANDERAVRCGVCCTAYTHLPRRLQLHATAATALRSLFGAGCLTLLALGVSGPPHLHLLCILILLLSTRSQQLAAFVLLLSVSVMAALYFRGLRLVLRTGGNGDVGLALIRYGAPVEGLKPGVLLVASRDLDNTTFARSVVLITEHGRQGAQGVMLTQPMQYLDQQQWSAQLLDAAASAQVSIRHYVGGPVGYPSQPGDPAQVLVLHQLQGLPGARPVLQPAAAAAGGLAAAATAMPGMEEAGLVGVGGRGRHAAARSELQQHMAEAYRRLGRSAGAQPAATTTTTSSTTTASSRATAANSREGDRGHTVRGRGPHRPTDESAGSSSSFRFSWFHRPSLRRRRSGFDRSTTGVDHDQTSAGRPAEDLFGPGLYAGGSLDEALRLVAVLQAGSGPQIHMFHGMCAWAAGQLEGEVRQGSWGFIPTAAAEDVVGRSPAALYQRLVQHDALRWL